MAGIRLFGYSLNAHVSTLLARLPHTLSPLWNIQTKKTQEKIENILIERNQNSKFFE